MADTVKEGALCYTIELILGYATLILWPKIRLCFKWIYFLSSGAVILGAVALVLSPWWCLIVVPVFFYLVWLRGFLEQRKIRKVAQSFGAQYISAKKDIALRQGMLAQYMSFEKRALKKLSIVLLIRKMVRIVSRVSHTADQVLESMYEIEYASAAELIALLKQENQKRVHSGKAGIRYSPERIEEALTGECQYMFLNLLLGTVGLERITGYNLEQLRKLVFFDVGAGSGELQRFLRSIGVPATNLAGSDVVAASVRRIEESGAAGYCGRLETLPLKPNTIDILLLSYFIDYDTNQKETFRSALRLVAPGGMLVFEGKLPSISGLAHMQNQDKNNFVTRGRSTAQDIKLICQALINEGEVQQKRVTVKKIISSKRSIYNRNGLNRLPSYFITFGIGSV